MGLASRVAARLQKIWTYRWPQLAISGSDYSARLESGWRRNVFVVAADGQDVASDTLQFYEEEFRLQELRLPSPDGELVFQTAPRGWYSYGLRVVRDGNILFQSHPEPFAYLQTIRAITAFRKSEAGKRQTEAARKVWPSIMVDFAFGFMFYIAAGFMSLREVALLGVAAGLALHCVQWLFDRVMTNRIELTGGLSTFGIFMLVASAGFAWLLDSDLAIQLRGSALGLLGAACLGVDAWLGGKYFGSRLAKYVTFVTLDPRKLALGSALVAAVMAVLNGAIALGLSRDTWLLYKYWLSPVLGMALGAWVLLKARTPPPPGTDSG